MRFYLEIFWVLFCLPLLNVYEIGLLERVLLFLWWLVFVLFGLLDVGEVGGLWGVGLKILLLQEQPN